MVKKLKSIYLKKSKKRNKSIKSNKSKKNSKKRYNTKKRFSKKNLKSKKRIMKGVMKGGNYNIDQVKIIKKILNAYNYTIEEQNSILNILNQSSQYYPFNQVLYQLDLEDPNIDFTNLTEEEIEEGRENIERIVEASNNFLDNYQGDTDNEKKTNSDEASD